MSYKITELINSLVLIENLLNFNISLQKQKEEYNMHKNGMVHFTIRTYKLQKTQNNST